MKKKDNKFKNRYFAEHLNCPLVNVGEELLRSIKGHRVVCATVTLADYRVSDTHGKNLNLELKMGYTKHQFQYVLNVLKHCWYEVEYGIQYFYGTIWCNNGIWFVRDVGDTSWKKYFSKKQYPPIPHKLN